MRRESGFTLLEVLVATAIMGIAVAGVMNGLSAAVRNASRITEYDRAAILARLKMDELLVDQTTPRNQQFGAQYGPMESGGVTAGWQARVVPFEAPGAITAGAVTSTVSGTPVRGWISRTRAG
jgi:type II secretion system protein I